MFEKAYRPSGTYLDRMRIEHAEYLERLHHLSDFTCSQKYRQLNETERNRLLNQLKIMYDLLQILGERIDYAESIAKNH